MLRQKQSMTLATACCEIEQGLKNLKLLPIQKKLLLDINQHIHAIHHVLRGWLKAGSVNTYKNKVKEGFDAIPPTQEVVMEEAKEAFRKTIGFLWVTSNKLLDEIEAEKKKNNSIAYNQLIENVEECILQLFRHLEKNIDPMTKEEKGENTLRVVSYTKKERDERIQQRRIKARQNPNIPIKLTEKQLDFYTFEKNPYAQSAKSLDGRYFPFSQELEPTRGLPSGDMYQFYGFCAGYTIHWAQAIANKQTDFKIFLLDKETYSLQEMNGLYQHFRFFYSPFSQNYKIKANENLQTTVNNLVDQLNSRKIYYLRMIFSESNCDHITGIRKIPNSTTIEFFDANSGIYAFNNTTNFKLWFFNYLSTEYKKLNQLNLSIAGNQPSTSAPILPNFMHNENVSNSNTTTKVAP